MGFTKLDEGIVFSSIMGEDDSVFKIFTVFLATCKHDGISHVSPVFISSVTHKPINEVLRCIKILESPDPHSRSIAEEGRRIIRVDGGYFIVNYKKYREYTYSDAPEAKRQRKHRENKPVTDCDMSRKHVTSRDISASVSSSASGIQEGMQGETPEQRMNERSIKFKAEIEATGYLDSMKANFYRYWSEPNKSKTKMRFELEPTWDLVRRLITWANRCKAPARPFGRKDTSIAELQEQAERVKLS